MSEVNQSEGKVLHKDVWRKGSQESSMSLKGPAARLVLPEAGGWTYYQKIIIIVSNWFSPCWFLLIWFFWFYFAFGFWDSFDCWDVYFSTMFFNTSEVLLQKCMSLQMEYWLGCSISVKCSQNRGLTPIEETRTTQDNISDNLPSTWTLK